MHTIAGKYFGITEISDCPVRNLASPLEWKKKTATSVTATSSAGGQRTQHWTTTSTVDAFPTATSTPLLFNKPRFEISVQPLGTLCTGIISAQRCPTVPSTQMYCTNPPKDRTGDLSSQFTPHAASHMQPSNACHLQCMPPQCTAITPLTIPIINSCFCKAGVGSQPPTPASISLSRLDVFSTVVPGRIY